MTPGLTRVAGMTPRTRRTPHAAATAALLAAGVILLAGCGGDRAAAAPVASSPATTGAATDSGAASAVDPDAGRADADDAAETPDATDPRDGPPLGEFLRRGNAICAAGNAELTAIGERAANADEAALLSSIAGEVVPSVRAQVAALRELGFPSGDVRLLTDLLAETDDVLDEWELDPSVAFSDTRINDLNTRLNDYGLTSCGDS